MITPHTIDIIDTDWHWSAPTDYEAELRPVETRELLREGSLTARAKQLAGNSFQLEVRDQCWRQVNVESQLMLFGQVAASKRVWSRKIAMLGHGEDWILAHTLMPETSAEGALSAVFDLKNKPLGDFLFEQPQLLRASFELGCSQQIIPQMWGRRSMFTLHSKPIMVAEFFTPAFFMEVEAQDNNKADAENIAEIYSVEG
ncbi:MAG: chorismate lyase [Gammaproteobacteria bacterium]|nr:chorismate lyase [Gammaproteobacteria bacterium]